MLEIALVIAFACVGAITVPYLIASFFSGTFDARKWNVITKISLLVVILYLIIALFEKFS